MRLVYSDPLEEVKSLIAEAKSNKAISHIALTTGELRACLSHKNAVEVFGTYVNDRQKKLNRVKTQIERLKKVIDGDTLTGEQKMPLFDQMDELEEQQENILNDVPSTLTEGGVTFKISMR